MYTSDQKSAIYAFLATAMCCDGSADPREQSVLREAIAYFQISSYEQQHATDKNINQQAAVLKSMSMDQKTTFGKYMKRTILADGYVERHEGFLFQKLMSDIGVNINSL